MFLPNSDYPVNQIFNDFFGTRQPATFPDGFRNSTRTNPLRECLNRPVRRRIVQNFLHVLTGNASTRSLMLRIRDGDRLPHAQTACIQFRVGCQQRLQPNTVLAGDDSRGLAWLDHVVAA
jgi:hypothetical protein